MKGGGGGTCSPHLSQCECNTGMEGGVRVTCLQTGPKNFVTGVVRWQSHEGLYIGSIKQCSIDLLGEIRGRHHHHVRIALLVTRYLHHSSATYCCWQPTLGSVASHCQVNSELVPTRYPLYLFTRQVCTTMRKAIYHLKGYRPCTLCHSKPTKEYNFLAW